MAYSGTLRRGAVCLCRFQKSDISYNVRVMNSSPYWGEYAALGSVIPFSGWSASIGYMNLTSSGLRPRRGWGLGPRICSNPYRILWPTHPGRIRFRLIGRLMMRRWSSEKWIFLAAFFLVLGFEKKNKSGIRTRKKSLRMRNEFETPNRSAIEAKTI